MCGRVNPLATKTALSSLSDPYAPETLPSELARFLQAPHIAIKRALAVHRSVRIGIEGNPCARKAKQRLAEPGDEQEGRR